MMLICMKNRQSPWAGKKQGVEVELIEEKWKYAEDYAVKKADKEKGIGDNKGEVVAEKSTFHGKEEKDYQGSGHTKGVSAIQFFPKQVHLLLSARIDSKVKIWDGIRDISFSNDGTKFLSTGYDKNIKYWDTKIWHVISTFSTGKVPYIYAGMHDKKIVQWDMNSRNITQEYDQHLGALNTITFVDDNRRFIIEPHMNSMPAISLHPNSNWLRFHLNKKKMFAGHIVAGYACQVNFSPEGQYVMSGDGEGKCWFWNWMACKVSRTLKCHEGVYIGVEWHPLEQSKVTTCGWDGLI
ncbi:hypothetical protein MKX03_030964 [Papaver bracteatum]|nr:hypothetical protein MKX03_030963 [Papaver bracteatum]KAI3860283.1 hypothetical protein MKX03_030964 [Papaver bracteatum]